MKLNRTPIAMILTLAAPVLVVGCGGSSSSGDGDVTPVASRGVITGFGSVYVDGRRYQTDDTRFEVDDSSGDQSDLRLGMVVTVVGTSDAAGLHASEIIYDNELKGPVSDIVIDPADATRKTLTILGQSVLVTADTTIDDDGSLTFDTIAIGDVLEVSGYIGAAQLVATHIELQDNDDEIEIKGAIENLESDSFEIHGFTISYDGSTDIDDDIGTLADGLYVEVKGQLNLAGDELIAAEIESEDDHYMDAAGEVEIKGLVSGYDPVEQTFMLQGQAIDAATAVLAPASLLLGDGLMVEVEGHIVDGVLIAAKIGLEDSDGGDDS